MMHDAYYQLLQYLNILNGHYHKNYYAIRTSLFTNNDVNFKLFMMENPCNEFWQYMRNIKDTSIESIVNGMMM